MGVNYVKYGWMLYGVVKFSREWCVICATQRYHEEFDNQKTCIACANIPNPEEQPYGTDS